MHVTMTMGSPNVVLGDDVCGQLQYDYEYSCD